MKKIVIIGYYDHFNAGDEQYKNTFVYLIKNILGFDDNHSISFIDCDKLKNYTKEIKDDDIIIAGGGDILNNYFLDKIIDVFNGKPNNIYAISVGVPYTNIMTSNKLHIFHSIFIRSYQDLYTMRLYHPNVYCIPDISYLAKYTFRTSANDDPGTALVSQLATIKKKKICFSLSRHIYHKDHIQYYYDIVDNLAKFIKYLIVMDYHVILLPFNTNKINSNENDILIHNDVIQKLEYLSHTNHVGHLEDITSITTQLNEQIISEIYSLCHVIIPMRFHSCLFSIYSSKPFLPIYTTRKINNLLTDVSWNYAYKLPTNKRDIPTELNLHILISRFNTLINEYTDVIMCIDNINYNLEEWTDNFQFIKLESNNNPNDKMIGKLIVKNNTTIDKIEMIKDKGIEYLKSINITDTDDLQQLLPNIKDPKLQNIIVQMVSYYLTDGNINSIYNYGLYEKMFKCDYNINREWAWVINDYKPIEMTSHPDGLFNLSYIDQIDYSGAHRSGWQYVYEHISILHNSKSNLLLDLYLDRTFHWNNDINKILGIIPYKQSWCGFLHHTFETQFSNYNCVELFKNENFLMSLPTCKGIFVLSDTLCEQVKSELVRCDFPGIPVYSFVHPTEINVPQFSFKNFINNDDKQIIHIGGWLRNIYNFYKLEIPNNIQITPRPNSITSYFSFKKVDSPLKKAILKGKNMNNYFPHETLLTDLKQLLINYDNIPSTNRINPNVSTNHPNVSTNCINNSPNTQIIYNNWSKHFYKDIETFSNSVNVIQHIDNNSYDNLLINNIVFINLVDASAVNTLVECIVRNTPIVINKIPAVVELLGKNYPLYYEKITDVYNLINQKNIKNAYTYLSKLPKTKFNITYFVSDLIHALKTVTSN
jgi:polysaccharide pyruvyl transferase WcaK-like protein